MFYVHPYLGKISILTNIFQRGWNHQLDKVSSQNLSSKQVHILLILAKISLVSLVCEEETLPKLEKKNGTPKAMSF